MNIKELKEKSKEVSEDYEIVVNFSKDKIQEVIVDNVKRQIILITDDLPF